MTFFLRAFCHTRTPIVFAVLGVSSSNRNQTRLGLKGTWRHNTWCYQASVTVRLDRSLSLPLSRSLLGGVLYGQTIQTQRQTTIECQTLAHNTVSPSQCKKHSSAKTSTCDEHKRALHEEVRRLTRRRKKSWCHLPSVMLRKSAECRRASNRSLSLSLARSLSFFNNAPPFLPRDARNTAVQRSAASTTVQSAHHASNTAVQRPAHATNITEGGRVFWSGKVGCNSSGIHVFRIKCRP